MQDNNHLRKFCQSRKLSIIQSLIVENINNFQEKYGKEREKNFDGQEQVGKVTDSSAVHVRNESDKQRVHRGRTGQAHVVMVTVKSYFLFSGLKLIISLLHLLSRLIAIPSG